MSNEIQVLLSEADMHLSAGNAYMISITTEITVPLSGSTDHTAYVNYPFESALKVHNSYNRIDPEDRKKIHDKVFMEYGMDIREDDLFGKLLMVLLFHLQSVDVIWVGLTGLGVNSAETLTVMLPGVARAENKTIILTRTIANQHEKASIKCL